MASFKGYGRYDHVTKKLMKLFIHVVVITLSLLILPTVSAQIYVCKDAAGRTLTADYPLAECANRSMRELDRNGVTRREIAAPLTRQQKRERQIEEDKRKAEAAAAEQIRLQDRALMTRYRNEADIQSARQRAITLLNEQMRIDTSSLTQEMKEMKNAEAAVVAATNTRRLTAQRRALEEANRTVELRLSSIEQRNADIERTHRQFDLNLKRFREIKALNDARDAAAESPQPTRALEHNDTLPAARSRAASR